jgi:hypothetical protein
MVENSQPFSSGAKPKEIQFILIHKYSGIRSNEMFFTLQNGRFKGTVTSFVVLSIK